MNNIPLTSEFTTLGGTWFVFRDGDRVIAAHNSNSAKERIFVNGELILKKRSINWRSENYFDLDNNSYKLTFITAKTLMAIECHLTKDGMCIGRLKAYVRYRSNISAPAKFLIFGLAGLTIGLLINFLVQSFQIDWLFPSILGMGLFLLVISLVIGDYETVVEEIDI
jgi:hypothetical protein